GRSGKESPVTVWPDAGNRGVVAVRSMLRLPTTTTCGTPASLLPPATGSDDSGARGGDRTPGGEEERMPTGCLLRAGSFRTLQPEDAGWRYLSFEVVRA